MNRDGYRGDLAWRINKIQRSLGIKVTEFPESDSSWFSEETESEDGDGDEEDLTAEERELKREEMEDEKESEWEGL